MVYPVDSIRAAAFDIALWPQCTIIGDLMLLVSNAPSLPRMFPGALSFATVLLALAVVVGSRARAQVVVASVEVGANIDAVAVNPSTNRIYFSTDGGVVAIDGVTNAVTSLSVVGYPGAIAVNPVTNTIYTCVNRPINVAGVAVTDGATNATSLVATGADPAAIAVNSATNKIYVANEQSDSVTVIDGATNTTATVTVGTSPEAIAVDSVTNEVYVANTGSNNVTVIDGATNATTTVTVGTGPEAVAVNPVTGVVYVVNDGDNSVTVIDGATNATATVPFPSQSSGLEGDNADSIAVNSVTNKIYVTDNYGTVTVIDGATNAAATVNLVLTSGADLAGGVAVDSATNQIYVVDWGNGGVTVINGATNATSTVNSGYATGIVGVNPSTNRAYVADLASVTVIDAVGLQEPSFLSQPESQTINTGSTVVFAASASGSPSYQWEYSNNGGLTWTSLMDGNGVSGSTGPQLVLQGASAAENGYYACAVATSSGYVLSSPASLLVASSSNPGNLINMSARSFVGTGDAILIGGFFVGGTTSRTVLVQALGPALAGDGLSGVLRKPALTIHDSTGGVIYSNTGWGSSRLLLNAAASVYAQPVLQPNSADSEVLVTLPPGGYTAEVTGDDGGTGIALCAIYELP